MGVDTMQVIVKGRNIEITDALRKYGEEKVSKLTKFYDQIIKTEIEFMVEKNPSISNKQSVEITLFTKGPVIKAKESSTDMYASIDMVTEKLERQIKKYKGKLYSSSNKGESPKSYRDSSKHENKEPKIVKTKQFAIKPMTPVEATLQMELLGHDFFVFTNSETGEVNVVYRRKDSNYGLIEPTFGLSSET